MKKINIYEKDITDILELIKGKTLIEKIRNFFLVKLVVQGSDSSWCVILSLSEPSILA